MDYDSYKRLDITKTIIELTRNLLKNARTEGPCT